MLDRLSRESSTAYLPRMSRTPRCASCSDTMLAPESSALMADGVVGHLWTCERCAETVVTKYDPDFAC